ncbi:ATP-binding protein [Paenibacillus tarimensis]
MNRYTKLIGLSLLLVYIGFIWFWNEPAYLNLLGINILQTMAALYAAAGLFLAYRKTNSVCWLYYFAGVFCYGAAQLYWTCFLLVFGEEPAVFGFPELLWMVQYIFYVMALYHQNKTNHRKPKLRFMLDVLLLATVSATMYWRHMIEPMVSAQMLSGEELLFNLFCSSANAVVFFGLLVLYIYERASIGSKSTLLLMVGFLLKSLGNTTALYLSGDAYWGEGLSWLPELCWFAGLMFLGFAPYIGIFEHDTGIFERSSKSLCFSKSLILQGGHTPEKVHSASTSGRYFLRRYIPLLIVLMLIMALIWSVRPLTFTLFGFTAAFVLLMLRLFVEIHDYKSADEALQESTRNFRNLVENSLVGVFTEQDGRLVYVNRYCEKLFGYEPGEMIGRPVSDFVPEAERQRLRKEFAALDTRGFTPRICFECRTKDQTVIYVDFQAAETMYRGRTAISGTLLDMTESKLSEQLLIRSEKLSVAGQLAAGVAHEIRNPLTALKGFTQLLHKKTDENQRFYELMLNELDRINYIVGEFMLLSKPNHNLRLEPHDLQEILSGIIPIIESQTIIHNITVQVDWNPELPTVRCDANQMKQVLINLLKNSIEAMPDGGRILVQFEADPKERVAISIADEGTGIPDEILNRLGEPFFTTKEKGTGLGLMVCYKIIQSHGGSVAFNNRPDKGTVVRISLPSQGKSLQ